MAALVAVPARAKSCAGPSSTPVSESDAAQFPGSAAVGIALPSAATTTALPRRSSKRTALMPPGARAVAVVCSVPLAKPPVGLVIDTCALVTGTQVLPVQTCCRSQAGLQPELTQTAPWHTWPLAQAGKQPLCAITQTGRAWGRSQRLPAAHAAPPPPLPTSQVRQT